MPDFETISPEGTPPKSRVLDAASLNAVVKKLIEKDSGSALLRQDVQKMWDGAPPFSDDYLVESGQDGRCNLNFGDGKARIKAEMTSYYDLTDSVPTLAYLETDFGDAAQRAEWSHVISEEFHRMLKEWPQFDMRFQLLVQKFCGHGVGFLYFKDDVDWRWEVAGLEDFKVPRQTELNEDECDVSVALRDVSISKLYSWIKDVEANDPRWNLGEVHKAILNASDGQQYTEGAWEKFQAVLKNNDVFASESARDTVKLAHVWVKEFSGRVSQFLTLRDGSNKDFLFKCPSRFDGVGQCFTFFPYEVGTNGLLHSVRGLAHEIYPQVQVLNSLRCQTVDNAKLAGSLLLQPKTETAAADMAILFYAGAAYLPPGVDVKEGPRGNLSTNILPVIQDMTLLMRRNTSDVPSSQPETERDKTKFQVQSEITQESAIPTASMDLFYQPWGRHLREVVRRATSKTLREVDPGADAVFAFRKRCLDREVPVEAIYGVKNVMPVRAIGYGSPTSRLLAFDEFMQYYGSLDPVGQNNLLRDRFAQKCTYSQVDRYVPRLDQGGRQPVDGEIAELQNFAMSAGKPMLVRPNENHIIHLGIHLPDIEQDLESLESNMAGPEVLQIVQIKIQHIAEHMNLLKPDKLQKDIVSELTRRFNNVSERVTAALKRAERQVQRDQQAEAEAGPQMSPDQQRKTQDHELSKQMLVENHQLRMTLREEDARQKRELRDEDAASRLRAEAAKTRFASVGPAPPAPTAATEQVVAPPLLV